MNQARIQDLQNFALPPNFRGRSSVFVQLWWFVQATFFRCSPQVMYGWRRWLLRLFGARIGKKVLIRPTVEITYPWKVSVGDWSWIGDYVTLYSLGEIHIGENSVVSQHTYVCAGSHDYTKSTFDIYGSAVRIESEAWIAARCFIAPGVRVGKGAVVGACSVVLADVPEMMLCAGSPARVLKHRTVDNLALTSS